MDGGLSSDDDQRSIDGSWRGVAIGDAATEPACAVGAGCGAGGSSQNVTYLGRQGYGYSDR